jgi:hypothetical protein
VRFQVSKVYCRVCTNTSEFYECDNRETSESSLQCNPGYTTAERNRSSFVDPLRTWRSQSVQNGGSRLFKIRKLKGRTRAFVYALSCSLPLKNGIQSLWQVSINIAPVQKAEAWFRRRAVRRATKHAQATIARGECPFEEVCSIELRLHLLSVCDTT